MRAERLARFAGVVALAVSGCATAPAPAPHAAHTGGYSTVGNRILDPSGHTFTMRGVNVLFDTAVDGLGRPPSDVTAIADQWGFNTIRLLVSEDFWIGSQRTVGGRPNPNFCKGDSGYVATIDRWVKQATAKHLLVLIDLHTNELNGTIPCGTTPLRRTMADEALAPTYWKQVASRYGGNPAVAFEPYNEPQCLTAAQWLHGGRVRANSCGRGGATYVAAGMQELYDVIRSTGTRDLVVIDGVKDPGTPNSGGYDLTYALNEPVRGTNIVYASHPYYGNDCVTMPPDIEAKVAKVSATLPVVIDEFGSSCTLVAGTVALVEYAQVIAFAEKHRLGWAAFAWDIHWCVKGVCDYGLVDSWQTFAPSIPGMPVYGNLQVHRTG